MVQVLEWAINGRFSIVADLARMSERNILSKSVSPADVQMLRDCGIAWGAA